MQVPTRRYVRGKGVVLAAHEAALEAKEGMQAAIDQSARAVAAASADAAAAVATAQRLGAPAVAFAQERGAAAIAAAAAEGEAAVRAAATAAAAAAAAAEAASAAVAAAPSVLAEPAVAALAVVVSAATDLKAATSTAQYSATLAAAQAALQEVPAEEPGRMEAGPVKPVLLAATADADHKAVRFAKAGSQRSSLPPCLDRYFGAANGRVPDWLEAYKVYQHGPATSADDGGDQVS